MIAIHDVKLEPNAAWVNEKIKIEVVILTHGFLQKYTHGELKVSTHKQMSRRKVTIN